MSRCPDRDDLQRFLTRQLAPADRAALADHLAGCPDCRAACARLDDGPAPTAAVAVSTDAGADAPTCRLWRQDLIPRSGQRPIQAPGLEWSPPIISAHPIPVIRGYEILGELGRGGMGIVYKARQTALNRTVALKMILASELSDPETLVRFRTEAEAVARLQHPNIVQVYEVGTAQGRPFYSLEYVGGGNVAQYIAGAAQPPNDAAGLVETLARAVHYAHERGVIHRDLKPANILLVSGGAVSGASSPDTIYHSPLTTHPKITDFGLAKYTAAAAAPQVAGRQTRPGLVVGTPQYMAPEQTSDTGEPVGPPADIYALGAILYELLTGRPPFQGGNALDTLLRVRCLDPVAPRVWEPKVPRDLETIALKCLEKDPTRRYASAAALADDLGRFRDGKPIAARPTRLSERVWKWVRRRPTVAALGLGALLGVGGLICLGKQADAYARAAETERRVAVQARFHAEEQRDRAEAELYLSRVVQAQLFYQAGHADRAATVLDLCRPTADQSDRRQWEWHFLHRLCRGEVAYRVVSNTEGQPAEDARPASRWETAAEGAVAAVSADGHWLATILVGEDTALIRDEQTGKLVATLTGARGPVALAFSPDGRRLAAVGADAALQLWDTATWQEVLALPAPAEPLGDRTAQPRLVFGADGATITAALWIGNTAVWDATPADGR